MVFGAFGGLRIKNFFKSKRAVLFCSLMALIIIVGVFVYYEYTYESHINDYISDECWYVSAARNIFRYYLGLTPYGIHNDYIMATVELNYPSSSEEYRSWVSEIEAFIKGYGGKVVKGYTYYQYKDNGDYLPAVCVSIPKENLVYISKLPHEVKYAIGYCYPNSKGILDYKNFEHPPLVKYLIGISMMTLGDRPEYWRVPSIIAGGLILVLIYLSFLKLYPLHIGGMLGVITAVITAFDMTFRSLSMVAMLDIFVALFTYLAYYLTLRRDLLLSSLSISLAFISKFSGAFSALPALIEFIRNKEIPAKVLLYLIYFPLTFLVVFSLPFIIKDGFSSWWSASVIGALHWHLSVKTTGGPPQAMPWDWLLGRHPFILHYTFNSATGRWVADLIASGDPVLYLLMVALSIYIVPHLLRLPDKGLTYDFTWGTYLMYYVIYALGAKTQYSFYSVQVVPLFYTLLIIEVFYLFSKPRRIVEIAKEWLRYFRLLILWLAGEVSIKVHVRVIAKERGK